ncbi:MAG TPA: non-canonical purine NTP pyrophosphatase [Phycisphaerales bacterium]|nr:non-canonical purine NTP pyrophosphatase [Phycisphaerales bacterium]
MIEIVIATGNPHKLEEIAAIFAGEGLAGVQLRSLAELGKAFTEPCETGSTFEANASIKALSYAQQTGMLCLADDSGLEVDALGGKPGVISSHYATDGAETGASRAQRDAANNARLLRELVGVAPDKRSARFVCVMALARGGSLLHTSRGAFDGRIGVPPAVPRGGNGFGYDPLFLVAPGFARTGAELPPEEKNAKSHRAHAARQMAAWLRENAMQFKQA